MPRPTVRRRPCTRTQAGRPTCQAEAGTSDGRWVGMRWECRGWWLAEVELRRWQYVVRSWAGPGRCLPSVCLCVHVCVRVCIRSCVFVENRLLILVL